MKLLRVTASHFKNACDHFSIDLLAKSRKTAEDKEYELQEIADGLYTQNTMAIVGKNASGKTTAVDLLDCCYSILGDFSLENRHYNYDGIHLEITFYHEGYIYRYTTGLSSGSTLSSRACFVDQQLLRKKYRKSNVNSIYDDDGFKRYPIFESCRRTPLSCSLSSKRKKPAPCILAATAKAWIRISVHLRH